MICDNSSGFFKWKIRFEALEQCHGFLGNIILIDLHPIDHQHKLPFLMRRVYSKPLNHIFSATTNVTLKGLCQLFGEHNLTLVTQYRLNIVNSIQNPARGFVEHRGMRA